MMKTTIPWRLTDGAAKSNIIKHVKARPPR